MRVVADRKNVESDEKQGNCRKKLKTSIEAAIGPPDFLNSLPDDILLCILSKLCSTADCPADFFNVLITCKNLNGLGLQSAVLSAAGDKTLAVKAKNWSELAERFLKRCADSGSAEACYTLGMIQFYCLGNRVGGAKLLESAAIASHAPALYSLAVIQFNGSRGSSNSDKDLSGGAALCERAAVLGHTDALRELGHCLLYGYGVRRDIAGGRRLLFRANARELALMGHPLAVLLRARFARGQRTLPVDGNGRCPLLSELGCNVPAPEIHPANRFLLEWYAGGGLEPELKVCCHSGCGRVESWRREFRRCAMCRVALYCSRACQIMDWKLRRKMVCELNPVGIDGNGGVAGAGI